MCVCVCVCMCVCDEEAELNANKKFEDALTASIIENLSERVTIMRKGQSFWRSAGEAPQKVQITSGFIACRLQ